MPHNAALFPDFSPLRVEIEGAVITGVKGGSGPPVLLLHGYPQTHAAWHRIAPLLAERYTVIATDLTGYGASTPARYDDVSRFSKAAMASDQVAVMRSLGFDSFAVVGHDRGGRVGYRMALDHPDAVRAFCSVTVIPTIEMWDGADKAFAMGAYHWFMLAQPHDLPERLIGADPDYFLDYTLKRGAGGSLEIYDPEALENYLHAFRNPLVRYAMCQDYRAAATIDADADEADRKAGRKLSCPVQILWTSRRVATAGQDTPLDVWSRWAGDVEGQALDAGHYMVEEAPDAVLAALEPFLNTHLYDK